RQEFEV
nr:Chain A, Microtubule-associated protein tau [Homo sapiens]6N4P_C Chain C, Microtubule-associated protein tau [Homo sapiens]